MGWRFESSRVHHIKKRLAGFGLQVFFLYRMEGAFDLVQVLYVSSVSARFFCFISRFCFDLNHHPDEKLTII
jgi:uncharacterized protein with GYD domain